MMASSLKQNPSRLVLVAVILFDAGEAVAQNGMYLVQPGAGYTFTDGLDLSDDGTTLVGAQGGSGDGRGYRFTRNNGRLDFVSEGAIPSVTSADARFTGGASVRTLPGTLEFRFFRESISGGVTNLATAFPSVAAMSASGNAMCGYNTRTGNIPEAFVWTPATGMQALRHPTLPIFASQARDMTADGLTIVGDYNVGLQSFPMIWRAETGMQQLPFLTGSTNSTAFAVSPNGSLIVGDALEAGSSKSLTLWTNENEPQSLGPLGSSENPTAVTNDGLIVGDWGGGSRGAWIWSAETGKMSLRNYAAMNGVEIDPIFNLAFCNSVSLDGRTFAGSLQLPDGNLRGYMLVIPSPSTALFAAVVCCPVMRRKRR